MPSTDGRQQRIEGATGDWEVVVGMEVHAQVTSRAKLFSGASTEFGGAPNSHVSLVDAAMPGMLPVINMECVAQAVRTGLGLKAKINRRSIFDRKNYFYPDLPQGYQISQCQQPIVGEGVVAVDLPDGESTSVGIERLHLEQDAGKSLHDQHATMSLVDLNRSGVALMEIVSKPDIRSAEEAKAYLVKLRSILRYLGTCDGDMEKGSLRADVNVSVRRPGEPLGTRCEIKNVNSIRFVGQAIDFEITAISPTLTCCRWNSTRPGSTGWLRRCRSCRMHGKRASSPPLASAPTTPACWSRKKRWPTISRPLLPAAMRSSPPIG
jgi:aspartyl-tRNA(Asn)/glutamyl-tRNA(Gln) amidotransferase subunit B